MVNVEGKEYYGIGIDNSELRKDAAQSKSILTSIGNSAEAEGARIDNSFRNAAAGAAAFFTAQQAAAFVSRIVEVRGQFQKFEAVLTNSLGSNSEAKKVMDDLNNFALTTPFNYDEMVGAFVKLVNQGFKPTMDEMTKLGDLASSTGKSFDMLAEAIIDAQTGEMERLKEFGIRASKDGDKITFTFKEQETVVKNSASAIREYILSLGEMKGVQGANAEIAKTLATQVSNLSGAIMNMYDEIGQQNEGVLSDTIAAADYMVRHYEEVGKALGVLIASYGAYKTAVFATIAVQRASAIASSVTAWFQLAHGIKTAKDAQIMFNLATKANPYVLAVSAIVALGTAIWAFHDSTTAAGKAQKQLNKEHEEVAQKKQELTFKTDSLISKINSETETVYSQIKAYKELIKLFPELGNMDYEEFKRLPQEQQNKMFSSINEKRELNGVAEAYEADLKRIDELKRRIKEVGGEVTYSQTSSNVNDLQKLRSDLEIVNNLAEFHKKEIDKIKEAQWEANTPVEEKVKHYEDVKKHLLEETVELEKTLTKSKDIVSVWVGVPDIIDNIKLDALNKQIDETTGKINSLTSNNTPVEQNKAYWGKKKKEAEDARDALDVSKKNSKDWNKYTREILQAQKELDKYDITGKADNEAAKLLKLQQDISRVILDGELKLQVERIAIMQDGKTKRLAIVEQEYKETLASINKEREEYKKSIMDAKGTEDPTVISSFGKREVNAGTKKTTDTIGIEKEYMQEYQDRTKALTDVFLNSEQQKLSAIKDRYDKERKWADEQLKTGGMTKNQHATFTTTVDKAQSKESYAAILTGLNDFEQQKADIETTWNTRIEAARDKMDITLEMRLQTGKSKALSSLNAQKLQESEEWQQLFSDLDNLTTSQIDNLITIIESRAKELKLDPVDARELTNSLNGAKQKIIEVNPFAELGKSFKTIFSSGAKESKKETNDIKKDWKDLAKSTEGCFSFINDAVASCSVLGDILGESGQEIIGMIQGVATAGIAMAAAIKTAETASVVLAAISLALTAVTALFSLFNGDKKKEKEVKYLQDQVDALGRSYEKLGRAIEKAYSHDAADLVEQQNKNLQQQNIAIHKQIEAEKGKKKVDKDKIKEWENAIEDNNQIIADNKDKAIDAIFGSDVKSAIDDFASAYVDAWAAGEDRSKSMKDVVKNMIKGVVVEMLKSDLAPTVAKLRERIQKALADNIISDAEQAEIDALVEAATQRADTKYAALDKYMKDAEEKETRSAQAQGIATASQESVDKNNGILANVQFYVAKATGLLEMAVAVQAAAKSDKTNPLLSVSMTISDNIKLLTQNSSAMLKHLAGIETNTAHCKRLENIEASMKSVKSGIEDINSQGIKIMTQ